VAKVFGADRVKPRDPHERRSPVRLATGIPPPRIVHLMNEATAAVPGAAEAAPGYVEDKEAVQRRLARIEGQVRGIQRMVGDEAYCIDVLTQLGAVGRALDGVALKLLEEHTTHCVRDALAEGGAEADEKVGELMAAVERFARTR
jgi:DNA-binding FrmR family transcriptional regulator